MLTLGKQLFLKNELFDKSSSIISIHPAFQSGRKEVFYTIIVNGVHLKLSQKKLLSLFSLEPPIKEGDNTIEDKLNSAIKRAEKDKSKIEKLDKKKSVKKSGEEKTEENKDEKR